MYTNVTFLGQTVKETKQVGFFNMSVKSKKLITSHKVFNLISKQVLKVLYIVNQNISSIKVVQLLHLLRDKKNNKYLCCLY